MANRKDPDLDKAIDAIMVGGLPSGLMSRIDDMLAQGEADKVIIAFVQKSANRYRNSPRDRKSIVSAARSYLTKRRRLGRNHT